MAMDDDSFEQVLDTVSRFARDRLIPAETKVEELDDIPEDIVQDMRDLGLFGLSIPESFGGLELTTLQESQVVEALCYASLSFRSRIGTNVGIGSQILADLGIDDMILLSNTQPTVVAIEGYGLNIVDHMPIPE